MVARRGAHLAAERGGAECRQGARRSVAVPNGEGVASGSATETKKRVRLFQSQTADLYDLFKIHEYMYFYNISERGSIYTKQIFITKRLNLNPCFFQLLE